MANIVTLSEVKTYLNITAVNLDAYLNAQIPEVSKYLEDVIGGAIAVDNFTETLNGSGSDIIVINKPPINSVSLLQYRITPRDAFQDLLPNNFATDVQIDVSNPYYVYLYSIGFPFGFQNIKITYNAGYTIIPNVFKRVAIEMISEQLSESKMGTGRVGISSKSLQAGSDSYYRLNDEHLKMLSQYIWRHK